jgi:hypothetical protein
MTLDEAIAALTKARAEVGGEAPLLMADGLHVVSFDARKAAPDIGFGPGTAAVHVSDSPQPEDEELERERPSLDLLSVLLADPDLVPVAAAEVSPRAIPSRMFRLVLEGLYRLQAEGRRPDLLTLSGHIEQQDVVDMLQSLRAIGLRNPDRTGTLQKALASFQAGSKA